MMMSSAPVQAQSLPDRPTLTPMPSATPISTKKQPQPTLIPSGRIAGTVINDTTGAPAPNIVVIVGDGTITTDTNGNYDRSGLAAGSYPIALSLTTNQGQADQGTLTIILPDGATVIQHLRFHSPVAPIPTVMPTAIPQLATLPKTGGDDSGFAVLAVGLLLILGAGLVRNWA
jgi:LPXTG-motif cell wall-anchored protein